jgi:hypothetical protein
MFPQELYGLVFGALCLLSQPFGLINIPMLSYNTKNNDYSLMNYILAGYSTLMLGVCWAIYRKYVTCKNKNSHLELSEKSTAL